VPYAANTLHVEPRVLSPRYLLSAPIGAHAVKRHPVISLNRDSSRNTIYFVCMWAISAKYARRKLRDIVLVTRLTFFLEYLTLIKKTRDCRLRDPNSTFLPYKPRHLFLVRRGIASDELYKEIFRSFRQFARATHCLTARRVRRAMHL
jgi:hypothetical protein